MFELDRARIRIAACLPLLAGLLLLAGCGGSSAIACSSGECTRILFLGNSYTYVNDLPSTLAQLAGSGGHPVQVAMVANGGETLTEHASSSDSLSEISSERWSYVVLQEQSETPATSGGRTAMYPAVRALVARIRSDGAAPMLFLTWAHRDGLPTAGLADYQSMQLQISNAYLAIAGELGAPVAPVGNAWSSVRHDHPEISLWADDGSHPDQAGTYLAACVFYAAIFKQSPDGLRYHGGVGNDQALVLQDEARRQVLDHLAQWGIR
jgi:hypothetical protein